MCSNGTGGLSPGLQGRVKLRRKTRCLPAINSNEVLAIPPDGFALAHRAASFPRVGSGVFGFDEMKHK